MDPDRGDIAVEWAHFGRICGVPGKLTGGTARLEPADQGPSQLNHRSAGGRVDISPSGCIRDGQPGPTTHSAVCIRSATLA